MSIDSIPPMTYIACVGLALNSRPTHSIDSIDPWYYTRHRVAQASHFTKL